MAGSLIAIAGEHRYMDDRPQYVTGGDQQHHVSAKLLTGE